jgi:hypothetical protein
MNHEDAPAYGLWVLVILNSIVFIVFAFTFGRPQSPRDCRSFGAFSAFIVALFTDMYGFPLTIYLLSDWLQTHYPGTDLMSHNAGHLWSTLIGLKGDPHFSALHLLSTAVMIGGFFLLGSAWRGCSASGWSPAWHAPGRPAQRAAGRSADRPSPRQSHVLLNSRSSIADTLAVNSL